jgi:hypothetical protein
MPCLACGNNAVKQAIAHFHALDDPIGLAKPHGILDLIVRHELCGILQNIVNELSIGRDRPPAEAEAVKPNANKLISAGPSKVAVPSALNDGIYQRAAPMWDFACAKLLFIFLFAAPRPVDGYFDR